MSVLLFVIFTGYASEDDRGEGILVLETDIVLAHDSESLKEKFTIDPNGILLSLDGSCDRDTTGTHLCISSRYFYITTVFRGDTSVEFILS